MRSQIMYCNTCKADKDHYDFVCDECLTNNDPFAVGPDDVPGKKEEPPAPPEGIIQAMANINEEPGEDRFRSADALAQAWEKEWEPLQLLSTIFQRWFDQCKANPADFAADAFGDAAGSAVYLQKMAKELGYRISVSGHK